MAKKKKAANVITTTLPKANAYSVLTLVLTFAILFLTIGAIIGAPYFYFLIKGDSVFNTSTPIVFDDTLRYAYYFIFSQFDNTMNYKQILGANMIGFHEAIILAPKTGGADGAGGAANIINLILQIAITAGGIFSALFLIIAIIKFMMAICAFKKGNFKALRTATRSVGTMAFLTFLPAIIINVIFGMIDQPVLNSLGAFFICIFALIAEFANSGLYHDHLKHAVAGEVVSASAETKPEKIEEEVDPHTCPVCGQHYEENDIVCKNCGTNLMTSTTPCSDMQESEEKAEAKDECSCCCGCCQSEEIEEVIEEAEEVKQEQPSEEISKPIQVEEKEEVVEDNDDVKVVVVNNSKVVDEHPSVTENNTRRVIKMVGLPLNLKELGDHRFSKNGQLQIARIPSNIKELGIGCFANCYNLEEVYIPISVTKICANALFACQKLRKIKYEGTIAQFRKIERQTNWLTHAGTNVISCADGDILIQ